MGDIKSKGGIEMTLEESKKILKDWVEYDLASLHGEVESDYAKFILRNVEAIELILSTVESLEKYS